MRTYRLPPRFYEDHVARDLPEQGATRIVKQTKSSVVVEMDAAAFDELRSDAAYYANEMGAAGFEGPEALGLIASARATVRALDKQGADAPTTTKENVMAAKSTKSTEPVVKSNPVADKLRAEVEKIEGVAITTSPNGNYYTVKVNGKTLGWVNGKQRIRIDFPVRAGKQTKMHVEKAGDVAKAIAKLRSYMPVAKPEPAKTTKPASSKSTKPKRGPRGLAKVVDPKAQA